MIIRAIAVVRRVGPRGNWRLYQGNGGPARAVSALYGRRRVYAWHRTGPLEGYSERIEALIEDLGAYIPPIWTLSGVYQGRSAPICTRIRRSRGVDALFGR